MSKHLEALGVRLPPRIANEIRRRAVAEDRPVSHVLRRLLVEALSR